MKLEGEVLVNSPREKVWRILNDREVLKKHMPGCETLEETEMDKFDAVITIGIGAIKGSYRAKINILNKKPPESYTLKLEGSGKPGFVKAEGDIHLEDRGNMTLLKYSGDLQVGGLIARVGQRIIGGITKNMTKKFFQDLAAEAESVE